MKIQRTIPPTAAPIGWNDLFHGIVGLFAGTGEVVRREEEIREFLGVRHVFLVSSGKAALYLTLSALKSLYPGKNEVIIPAYTCFSVPSAIVKAGLKVVPCDIDPATFDFDYSELSKSTNDRTLCIVPGHLFGIPSDIDAVIGVAKGKGIAVVEDSAQAMGVFSQSKNLGTMGDVGFYSLGRGKNVTCGAGGVIVTNSDIIGLEIEKQYRMTGIPGIQKEIAEIIKMLVLKLFISPSLYWFPTGIPALKLGETIFYRDFPVERLSGMQAGVLRGWKARLKESNRIRRDNAEWFIGRLDVRPVNKKDASYLRLPFLLESRDKRDNMFNISREKGLGLSKMYPTPVNEIEEIKNEMGKETYPGAKAVCERLINIPVHQLLCDKDKDAIIKMINENA